MHIAITGATSGIGFHCAKLLANRGARLLLLGRDEDKLKNTITLLPSGYSHGYHLCDLTRLDEIKPNIEQAIGEFGRVDGFVHSAGIQITCPFQYITPSTYLDIFNLNTISAFEITRILAQKKHRNEAFSVVFISALAGELGMPGLTAYSASKAGLSGGARAMAIELAPKNIRVNCISPGHIFDTPMMQGLTSTLTTEELETLRSIYPLGPGNTDDVANMCFFLLSDKSRWITGQNMILDGGASAR